MNHIKIFVNNYIGLLHQPVADICRRLHLQAHLQMGEHEGMYRCIERADPLAVYQRARMPRLDAHPPSLSPQGLAFRQQDHILT